MHLLPNTPISVKKHDFLQAPVTEKTQIQEHLSVNCENDIDLAVVKVYEIIHRNIIQRNIEFATSKLFKFFKRKLQSKLNKSWKKLKKNCLEKENCKSVERCNSMPIRSALDVDAQCEKIRAIINEKFEEAKNNNQIRRIFREMKNIISELIAVEIDLSYLPKIKKPIPKRRNFIPIFRCIVTRAAVKEFFHQSSYVEYFQHVKQIWLKLHLKLNWKYRKKCE